MTYQLVTVSVIVQEEDVESVKREFNQTLEMLSEDYKLHEERIVVEECEEPDDDSDEDLFDYEDVA